MPMNTMDKELIAKQMKIRKISLNDVEEVYLVKQKAFMPLLEKYKDFETSPACEPIEKLYMQIAQQEVEYFVLFYKDNIVGGAKVQPVDTNKFKIAPIYLLPKMQGMGLGTLFMKELFYMFPNANWILDTIITEEGNCTFYKKMGFVPNGTRYQLNEKLILEEYNRVAVR